MDLYALTRGQVRDLVLREFGGHFGDGFQLRGRQASARYLGAQHVDALLALAVHALLQADRGETVRIDAALAEARYRLLEAGYLFQIGQILCRYAHVLFPPNRQPA